MYFFDFLGRHNGQFGSTRVFIAVKMQNQRSNLEMITRESDPRNARSGSG